MRKLLLAAAAAALSSLATVQLASAAATIPDSQARVNTRSSMYGAAIRYSYGALGAPQGFAAPQWNDPYAQPPFYETPARR